MSTTAGAGRVDVAAVRARHRLADVVAAQGIDLRPVGRGFMGCCPFHDDSTASLSVDGVPDRFHCFGCGASGDVIDFIARMHHLGFRDAVAHLDGHHHRPGPDAAPARRLRIVPGRDQPVPGPTPERAHQIHQWAWEHYTTPIAHATATAWLTTRRGIPVAHLEDHLRAPVAGSAGNAWSGLVDHLRAKGVQDAELTALDLARATRHGNLVDTYRNRVILPVRDEHDRILGFLGRDTSGHPGAPKYRNPTRTTTYDKSRLLYRPDPARPVPDGARLVVVEGPLDALAVAAHAARWGRADDFVAVAACGAAATPQHADAIARLRNGPVVIALDADPAGARGTLAWVDLLARQRQQSVHVAELPDGQDPAARLAHQPRAALGDFDPGAGPWSPKPPGAHLVQLALAGTLPADPSRAVLDALTRYADLLDPRDARDLVARAEAAMTRQGWNPRGSFSHAARAAGLPDPHEPGTDPPVLLPHHRPTVERSL